MSVLDTAEYRRLALIAAGVDPCDIPCILDTAAWRRLMLQALYDLSQGGGGSPGYINGSVQFYTDLPVTVGTPAVNIAYLVRENSGVWFINRKPAGIYVRLFNNGDLNDWDYAGTFPEVNDAQYFRIYDSADPTREVAFNVSGVAAATTRTLTVPNANGTIALTSDFAVPPAIGSTTPAAGTFTNLVANTELQVPSAAPASPSAGDIYRVTDTIRYRDSGNTERLLLNATDNLSGLANTATARTNIGLGSADSVTFGSLQNTPIGSTTAASGAFTTLNANNGTITASAPVLNLSQTWNNASVAFTGLKSNVTATAAASNSMFADIQAGGYSQFGIARISSTSNAVWLYNTNSGTNTNGVGANYERAKIAWSSNVLQIGTEKAGTGSARNLEFQVDGTTRLTLNTSGNAIFTGIIATSSSVQLSSNFTMSAASAASTLNCTSNPSAIRLYGLGNDGGSSTNTERLLISTRTGASYFISTQATGTGTVRALELRTNDVARLTIEAAGGLTVADANDIAVGTTTGTKIATGTTQRLGFWNATPSAQPAAVADATDAASTQARLNDLLGRLRTIGIIAT